MKIKSFSSIGVACNIVHFMNNRFLFKVGEKQIETLHHCKLCEYKTGTSLDAVIMFYDAFRSAFLVDLIFLKVSTAINAFYNPSGPLSWWT